MEAGLPSICAAHVAMRMHDYHLSYRVQQQRWEKVKLAYDLVLKLDPFLLTQTIVKFDVFLESKLKL